LALRKPFSLAYSSYLGGCAELLANVGATRSDAVLPCFIRLQTLQEEIIRAFQYDNAPHQVESDIEKVEPLSRRFEQRLEQEKSSWPPELWSHGEF
jgi:hypothetical protein